MEVVRYHGISVLLLPAIVTGLNFSFDKESVLLGSTGTLTMTCDITETDVETVYLIQIRRIKSTSLSGEEKSHWETLALMQISKNESPTLDEGITAATKDYVAGGSWDSTTPSKTYLTVSMNMEKLVCEDARYYICELTYKSSTSDTNKSEKNATFSAYVMPQVTSLDVKRKSFIVQESSPMDVAAVQVGDELELTCTANIGRLPGTIIRWHRTSETASTTEFIGYQPPEGTYNDGTAITNNQCGYTRVANIKYNATAADANRDNYLAFECYVTVSGGAYGNSYTSENNPRFYADVTNQKSDDKAGTESNNTHIDGTIIGGVVGGLVAIILIVVIIWWFLWFRRRGDGANSPEKQIQHQRRESRETELSDLTNTTNNYEQLQNRSDTESTMAYDSLHGPDRQVHRQSRESQKTGLGDSATIPENYEQLQNRSETDSTMTYDSLHAGSSKGQSSQSHYENLTKDRAGESHAGMQPRR